MTSKTSAPKSTKATKSTKPASSAKSTKTSKSTKTVSRSTTNSSVKSKKDTGRFIACIVGAVAMIALIIIAAVTLATSIGKNGKNALTVADGNGQKVTTEYLGFDGFNFRLKIPTSFYSLSTNAIREKYGTEDAPKIVYSSEGNEANVTINPTDSAVSNDELKTYLNTFKSFMTIGGEIVKTDYFTQGNHNVAYMQFITDSSSEDKYYNEAIAFSQDGKLTLVTFNCKESQRGKWQPVGEFILKSIDFIK